MNEWVEYTEEEEKEHWRRQLQRSWNSWKEESCLKQSRISGRISKEERRRIEKKREKRTEEKKERTKNQRGIQALRVTRKGKTNKRKQKRRNDQQEQEKEGNTKTTRTNNRTQEKRRNEWMEWTELIRIWFMLKSDPNNNQLFIYSIEHILSMLLYTLNGVQYYRQGRYIAEFLYFMLLQYKDLICFPFFLAFPLFSIEFSHSSESPFLSSIFPHFSLSFFPLSTLFS